MTNAAAAAAARRLIARRVRSGPPRGWRTTAFLHESSESRKRAGAAVAALRPAAPAVRAAHASWEGDRFVLPSTIFSGPGTGAMEHGLSARNEGGARPSEEAVTVCQSTGTGVHHLDLANTAKAAARKAGLGREFRA